MNNSIKKITPRETPVIKWGACTVYFLFLISSCIYSFKKPLYNWDMLAYMAITIQADNNGPATIHATVYNNARLHVPAVAYARLADTTHPVKKKMLTDAAAFNSQLAYYTVKPLYTFMVYLSYKAGLSLTSATVLPSVISYFLIGILSFYWLVKYICFLFALVCSACIMLTAPLFNAAKLSTPDCLSGLLLFTTFYLVLEHRRLLPVFLFLFLAILARIDNIIAAFFIISLLAFTSKWSAKVSIKKYLLMAAAFTACYFAISYTDVKYGWSIFFYPSFALHLEKQLTTGFSLTEYIRLLASGLLIGLYYSQLLIYILLLLFVWANRTFNDAAIGLDKLLALLIIAIIAARFLLLPEIDDRFYTGFYLTAIMLLVRKIFPIVQPAV